MQKTFEFAGAQGKRASLNLAMANRHGIITGATGSGKTVTLQSLVEGFSRAGVPTLVTDIKGDLSGLAQPGERSTAIVSRLGQLSFSAYSNRSYPVIFWDLFGKKGHAVRTTISDMGPLLLSSLLELNETQTAILYACFKIADEEGLLLLDMKDLRSLLTWMAENSKSLQMQYGNISSASIAAIQRGLLVLEQQGAEQFFGEPAIQLSDLMQVDFSGDGVVSLLDATALLRQPKLYATFLLWMLAELFEQLPELGDPKKPSLVLFFDEAHVIFNNAPDALLEKVEQVVRLIRSKGVGIYFISQTPADVPASIAGQLGNRIQHVLRAFTPKDQKVVKAAAQTLRPNPMINTEQVISQLAVGEALISVLNENGQPLPVERLLVFPPQSRIGPITDVERQQHLLRSPLMSRYDKAIDRESAYEILRQRAESGDYNKDNAKSVRKSTSQTERNQIEDLVGAMAKSAVRSIGSQLGRRIARGLLGSLLGGKRR